MRRPSFHRFHPAFTVIELLVTVVLIAILATFTFVVYPNVAKSAFKATMSSSLSSSYRAILSFEATNNKYPSTVSCDSSLNTQGSTSNLCLRPGDDFTYSYQVDNNSTPKSFALYAISQDKSVILRVTDYSQAPKQVSMVCPLNFILVPGSSTYGTSDFCVAKYEMRQYNTALGTTYAYSSTNLNYPISRAGNIPWVNISQNNAIINATHTLVSTQNSTGDNVTECPTNTCHLITEAEWMTLAQNVLNQGINWSSGVVGTGYIYRGHRDNSPATALAADDNDNNGYANTGDNSVSGNDQKRTLKLSNDEVIWDMSGNVSEWTAGTVTGTQPTDGSLAMWWSGLQWSAVKSRGSLVIDPTAAGTGIPGASKWDMNNGIGYVYTCDSACTSVTHAFIRGGYWNIGIYGAGVLSLDLTYGSNNYLPYVGFRVTSSGL